MASQASDLAYEACRVPFNTNLFVIGTFAAPISFSSQQQRALNLVWGIQKTMALEGQEPNLRDKKIAIVGAGVSGMTSALACKSLGADVWLYEKDSEVLNRFNQADHRELHPTINFWPQQNLRCTTKLPFFNWHSDKCDSIMTEIRKQWASLHVDPSSMIANHKGHEVRSIQNENDMWGIDGYDLINEQNFSVKGFDILILAPGFGDEHGLTKYDTPCYWASEQDLIKKFKKSNLESGFREFVISGNGDGGLIETFRLVFKEFVAGKLEKEFSAILNEPTIKSRVLELESFVNTRLSDINNHTLDIDRSLIQKREMSEYLWLGYSSIIKSKMTGPAWDTLFAKLRREYISEVSLLGTEITPMQFTASPFHRLLLTLCISQGWVKYYQLASSDDLKHSECIEPVNSFSKQKTKKIKFRYLRRYCENSISIIPEEKRKTFQKSKCFYLARIGFNKSVETILCSLDDDDLLATVRRQQSLLTRYAGISEDALDFFSKNIGKKFKFGSPQWARNHFPVAKDYLKKFGIDLANSFDTPIYDGTISMSDEDQVRYDEMKSFIPEQFYGITINIPGISEPFTFSARGISELNK